MSKGKFSKVQRDAIWTRSRGRCEVCGRSLPEKGWNLHHRQGRGMGGTVRPVTCADGLAICGAGNTSGCHRLVDEHRAWALARGYVVSRFGPKPIEVPVLHSQHGWVKLMADGRVYSTERVA